MIGRTNASASLGGGAELNFEVVGGTTQPSNPKENTIWVNTDVEITSWVFAAEQPTGTDGMVWIRTGTASPCPFNAVEDYVLTIYPEAAKQYVNGVWSSKTAQIYQNGEWFDWLDYLFRRGDGQIVPFSYNAASGAPITISSDSIYFAHLNSTYNLSNLYTENKISLNAGDVVVFDVNCTYQFGVAGDWTDGWGRRVGIYTAQNGQGTQSHVNAVACTTLIGDSVRRQYKVPVTTTGNYYVSCNGCGEAYIANIWIERN